MIKTMIKVTCEECEDMIAEYPFFITKTQVDKEVEAWGGLVFEDRHFCNAGCYADFCSDANCTKDDGGQDD